MSECLVVIPTYNEKENIERIIRKVFSLSKRFDVLIVDDGSPDGTANIVKKLQQEFPNQLHIEERTGKLGLGTAYIHSFYWALERSYEFVFEMDADFSHNPEDLVNLYNHAVETNADLVIGSRYVKGVNVVNWPIGRVLMSYYASVYVRCITGMPIHDSTAGFVCYRRKVLETIGIDDISFKGYAFQIEMKFKTWKHGFKIEEFPIIFTDRREGDSKMSGGIFKEALFGVMSMKIKSLFKRYNN
jgi:dolichol-phosphate mannosyltransferase